MTDAVDGAPRHSVGAAAGDQVNIDNFAFAPATLTVSAGSTVTWTNHDEEPHTVAASDGSFHSPGMGTGATFSHTFSTAGTFDYVCSIHPMMHGTVVVTLMTRDPNTMSRRQLIRHTAWFGAAVGFGRGRRRGHLACRRRGGSRARARPAHLAIRPSQRQPHRLHRCGQPERRRHVRPRDRSINNLGYTPDFVIHTGDLTHLSTPDQFDQVKQMMSGLKTPHVFTVPGEHDSVDDAGQKYRSVFGAGTAATGGTASTSPACT